MNDNQGPLTSAVRRLGGTYEEAEPAPTSPEYMRYRFAQEMELFIGSMFVTAAGGAVMILAAYIGDREAGTRGQNAGLDVGLGFVAFGFAGCLIHWTRTWVNLLYRRILYRGQDPLFMKIAPAPSPAMRPFLTSSDWDFVVQGVVAVIVTPLLLHFNP